MENYNDEVNNVDEDFNENPNPNPKSQETTNPVLGPRNSIGINDLFRARLPVSSANANKLSMFVILVIIFFFNPKYLFSLDYIFVIINLGPKP